MRKTQITVLIADNSILIRDTLRMIIGKMEDVTIVCEAQNGEEAIGLARKHSPDVILIDINMTPVNGFEATRKIVKENPACRIIGISMHNKASYARNMLKLGAWGYLIKGSPHHEIMEAIRKVAAGQKYIDKNLVGNI